VTLESVYVGHTSTPYGVAFLIWRSGCGYEIVASCPAG
jgi:hypothetical protein